MEIKDIFKLVEKELLQVKAEISVIENDLSDYSAGEVFKYFFKHPGKMLRPTLAFLSAGIVNHQGLDTVAHRLVKLGVALELIHNASLIHDDIIDRDLERRGNKTLNNVYGNKIAVWAGDVLYTRAFSILSGDLAKDFSIQMADVAKIMGIVEILQAAAGENSPEHEKYLELIKGKTAILMGTSCKLGAILAGADKIQANAMESFGVNFGMVYQIVDDFVDDDPLGEDNASIEEAKSYAEKARSSINQFADSQFKKALYSLIDYVMI